MTLFFSKLFRLFVVLSFLTLVTLYFLPTIANTNWGRQRIVNMINRSIPGNVEIKGLELSWGKGQVIQGFLLKDPQGRSIIEIDRFSTDATLIQLLRKETHLGFTQIQDLNAAVITDEQGLTNIQQALGISPSPDTPRLLPSTILLSDVNTDLYLFSENRPLSAVINGKTKQDNLSGSFEINITLNGLNGKNWDALVKDASRYFSIEGSKEARIQGRVVNFPVDLIDRLVALKKPELNGFFHALLGERLDLTIDKEPNTEGLAFNVTLQSPLAEGGMKGLITDEAFNLLQPATVRFTLTPKAINAYLSHSIDLLNETRLTLSVEEFSIPMILLGHKQKDGSCRHFGLKGKADLIKADLDVGSIGVVSIDNVKAAIDSATSQPDIQISFQGQAQYAKQPFEFTLGSTLKKPRTIATATDDLLDKPRGFITLQQMPLKLLPFLDSRTIELIGHSANVNGTIEPSTQGDILLNLAADTPLASLEKTVLSLDLQTEMLFLVNPTTIRWKGVTDCVNTTESPKKDNCTIDILINGLKTPLNIFRTGKHLLNIGIKQANIPHVIEGHYAQLDDVDVKIEGPSLEDLVIQTQGKVMIYRNDGKASPFLSKPLQLVQKSNWKVNEQGVPRMSSGKLHLKNQGTELRLNARYNSEKGFALTEPARISYILTPEIFDQLQKQLVGTSFILHKDTPLQMTIESLSFPFKSQHPLLTQLRAKGFVTTDQMSFKNGNRGEPSINQIAVPWTVDGPLNAINMNLSALAYPSLEEKPGKLSIRVEMENWHNSDGTIDLTHSKTELQADITNLSTSASSMMLTTYDLSPIFGPDMDIALQSLYDLDHKVPGYLMLNLDSSKLHANARFKLGENLILFDPVKPVNVRWTLSPRGFTYLKELSHWTEERELDTSVTLNANLTELSIPLKDPTNWINCSLFDFNFYTDEIIWKGYSDFPIRFEGNLSTQKLQDFLHGDIHIHTPSASPISIKSKLSNLLTDSEEIKNWKEMNLELSIKAKHLTPPFLQTLLFLTDRTKLQVKAILGELFSAKWESKWEQLSGPTQLTIDGSKGNLKVDGIMSNGVLALSSPPKCSFTMSPLLSQVLFSSSLPLLNSAISSDQQIELTIDPDQFSFPLIPFDIMKVNINKGELNLGKINFKNEGAIQTVLNLISPIRETQFSIWFTPIYFNLTKGNFTFDRLDMLIANTYTLASWGSLNLKKEQADIVLGITADTLEQTFDIRNLEDTYLLQIPLRVKHRKVDIDSKKLAAQITALVAQKKISSKKDVLDSVLNLVMLDQQGPAPLPTTTPFPWQSKY